MQARYKGYVGLYIDPPPPHSYVLCFSSSHKNIKIVIKTTLSVLIFPRGGGGGRHTFQHRSLYLRAKPLLFYYPGSPAPVMCLHAHEDVIFDLDTK